MRDELRLRDGTIVTIRPIRPTDSGIEQDFIARLSPRSRRYRFLSGLKELTSEMLKRFIEVDYPGEMALIATVPVDGHEREIAVARYAHGSAPDRVEFAIVVADEWQGRGIGPSLLRRLFEIARSQGFAAIEGVVLQENRTMLQLMSGMGFTRESTLDDPSVVHMAKLLR